jgi:ribosomal protein S18 acetylase RimI-like enzyme
MSQITVRRATLDDVERAATLGTEIVKHHHHTNPARFFMVEDVEHTYAWWLRQELERPEAVVLLAERAGQVVGYAYGAIEPRDWGVLLDEHGALHDLFVTPDARRNGVGRALVQALMDALTQLGANLLILRVMIQNEPARRLAESFGFATTMLELSKTNTKPSAGA